MAFWRGEERLHEGLQLDRRAPCVRRLTASSMRKHGGSHAAGEGLRRGEVRRVPEALREQIMKASDKDMGDKSDNSGDMSSENEIGPKGEEPAPERSGVGASVMKEPALDFQASKEVSLWSEMLFRASSNNSF